MMEPRCEQELPKLDRPWRRMAWVLPASLGLWLAALAGFSMLMGPIVQPPQVAPLEVSLANPPGIAGGAPGGGRGRARGAGTSGLESVPHPPKIGAETPGHQRHRAAARRPVPPAARPAKRSASITRRKRREAVFRPASDETALIHPLPRPRSASEEDRSAVTQPRAIKNAASLPPVIRPVPPPEHRAIASLAPSAAGNGGGPAAGGNAGQGHGAGDGAGPDSIPHTTVAHPPIPVYRVLPTYPLAARARGLQGEVVLRAVVDREGGVEPAIEVVESVPALDRAAIEALRQWRFEPGRDADNRAVPMVIQVPLRFRLR